MLEYHTAWKQSLHNCRNEHNRACVHIVHIQTWIFHNMIVISCRCRAEDAAAFTPRHLEIFHVCKHCTTVMISISPLCYLQRFLRPTKTLLYVFNSGWCNHSIKMCNHNQDEDCNVGKLLRDAFEFPL